jgi:hypothetical protein
MTMRTPPHALGRCCPPKCPRCNCATTHSVTYRDGTRTRRCDRCGTLCAGEPVAAQGRADSARRAEAKARSAP